MGSRLVYASIVLIAPATLIGLDALGAAAIGMPLVPVYLAGPFGTWVGVGAITLFAWLGAALLGPRLGRAIDAWPIAVSAVVFLLFGSISDVSRTLACLVGIVLLSALLVGLRHVGRSSHGAVLHVVLPASLYLLLIHGQPLGFVLVPLLWLPSLRHSTATVVLGRCAACLWLVCAAFAASARGPGWEAMPDSANPLPTSAMAGTSNVILIVMDTARKDDLQLSSTDGRTPRLSALAEDGIVVNRYLSNAPWTPPSHASMFTGLYSNEHGVVATDVTGKAKVQPLRAELTTLAEHLAGAGVDTAGVFANAFLKRDFGFHQGFRSYEHVKSQDVTLAVALHSGIFRRLDRAFPRKSFREASRCNDNGVAISRDVLARADAWLDSRNSAQPFFLFINVMDQHYLRYLADPESGQVMVGPKCYWETEERLHLEPETMSQRNASLLQWQHDTMRYLDQQLGAFFDRLKERALYDDTTIFVTADHGNLFGERGFYGHRTTVYHENLAVPFIVKYASQAKGRTPDPGRVHEHVDLFAEVLALNGLATPEGVHGRPFVARGDKHSRAMLYHRPDLRASLRSLLGRDLCSTVIDISDRSYQVIASTSGAHEVYELDADLYASGTNLYSRMRDVAAVASFVRELEGNLSRAPRSSPGKPTNSETLKELRALGYVD